jgi:Phosphopantetheine attachment site
MANRIAHTMVARRGAGPEPVALLLDPDAPLLATIFGMRLLAHIEKMLGKSVPLSALFQAPTIEQLASILRQERWSPPWSSPLVIQPQGSKPPFFCVTDMMVGRRWRRI